MESESENRIVNASTPNNEGAKNADKLTPLDELLKKADVLLMIYPKDREGDFSFDIIQEDERLVLRALKEKKETKNNLIILLDTGGGDVYTAVKVMDLLRAKYKNIKIAVAQEAKSSGTMMCLGANSVIMSPLSELGPLDKPMIHPDNETSAISALDIVRSLDGVLDVAKVRQEKLALSLINKQGIRKEKAFEIAGDTIAKLLSPILGKEDGKIYNKARRLLVIAELYGKEFLENYMLAYFKNYSTRKKAASLVIDKFIWGYPDHRFAVRREELSEELFFVVEKSEDVDYWDGLWEEFVKRSNGNKKIIEFL